MQLSLHRRSNGYSKRRFFFQSMGSSLALPPGDYEIWCVGAGSKGQSTSDSGGVRSGAAGGCGIKRITTTATHYIYISGGNVYFGPNNSSSGALASGLAASGIVGGTATGDEAYSGGNGAIGTSGGAGCLGGHAAAYNVGGRAIGGTVSTITVGTNSYSGAAAFSTSSHAFPAYTTTSQLTPSVANSSTADWWTPWDFAGFPETPTGAGGGNSSICHGTPAYPGCGGASGVRSTSLISEPTMGGLMAGGGASTGQSSNYAAPGGPGGGGGSSDYSGGGYGGDGGQAFAIIYSN